MADIKITIATNISQEEIDALAVIHGYIPNPDQTKQDFAIEKLTQYVNMRIVELNKNVKLLNQEEILKAEEKARLIELNFKSKK